MQSSKIEELKRKRQAEIGPKKSQLPYLVAIISMVLIYYYYLLNKNRAYSIIWVVGILMGIIMQRTRFCFVASFRDPIIVGTTSLFRAIIIGLAISTVGFGVIQYKVISNIPNYYVSDIPGMIAPVGFHTVVGSVLFGIGMVIAGACTSGTLIRIGEGHLLQIVVLIGFIIGTVLGIRQFEFWDKLSISSSRAIYLPQYLGFFPTIILQLAVFGILYIFANWYDNKNNIMKL